MSKEVITRYTGVFAQPTFSVNGGGEDLQISIRELGKEGEKVVFTGCAFSQKEYERRGGKKKETRYFANFQKPKDE